MVGSTQWNTTRTNGLGLLFLIYTVFQKSDTKIQITITTAIGVLLGVLRVLQHPQAVEEVGNF